MTEMTSIAFAPVHPVRDGLIVRADPVDCSGLHRYSIVHVSTGRVLSSGAAERCAVHVEQVLAIIDRYPGIDWALAAPYAAHRRDCLRIRSRLLELPLCFDPETDRIVPCLGDLPVPGSG